MLVWLAIAGSKRIRMLWKTGRYRPSPQTLEKSKEIKVLSIDRRNSLHFPFLHFRLIIPPDNHASAGQRVEWPSGPFGYIIQVESGVTGTAVDGKQLSR
ncbi:hypothetical protein IFM89_012832 [Coptis chinensis]|uniref:Uncharacterized protein n=1 Tax=Coptis chinensis TaxID=261450 RepID=A0A835LM16_9MAGN|nr:hypothetical protein IFM89_012832 [Coptis chinensis]